MKMIANTINKRGRPLGQRYDCKVDLRISTPMQRILKQLSRETKQSQAELIRCGIGTLLAKACEDWIRIAQDQKSGGFQKLNAIKNIGLGREAIISCSVMGLERVRNKMKIKEKVCGS